MKIKILAGSGFLLNTILFATYYAVAKEALSRIDPIVFTFFEMVALVPAGLLIVFCSRKEINRAVIRRGILLGSTLCLALFTIAIALEYTTATSTAFFPALNGFIAALIAWALFREPLKGTTWLAGLLAIGGAALLIFTSSMGSWRGTLIAFLGGLFYTCYVFLCDQQQAEQGRWALFGVELLTTAAWASLVVLLFGDWQAVHPNLPKDILVVCYVAGACTFVPVLITVLLQKYLSPVTVSFIYILEPVLGAVIAYLYLRETLSIQGYIGGGLVVLGAIIHTCGTMGRPVKQRAPAVQHMSGSWVSTLLYPGLGCALGAVLLVYLGGGLPPSSWRDVARLWPQLAQDMQQGQGTYATLLLVQAGGWLVAWLSVLVMGALACYHTLRRLFLPVQSPQYALAQPKEARAMQPVQLVQHTANKVLIPSAIRMQAAPRVPEQPARRSAAQAVERSIPRTTVQLPEQSTWSGASVWEAAPARSSRRMYPATEPLQHDVELPVKRRASLVRQEIV